MEQNEYLIMSGKIKIMCDKYMSLLRGLLDLMQANRDSVAPNEGGFECINTVRCTLEIDLEHRCGLLLPEIIG